MKSKELKRKIHSLSKDELIDLIIELNQKPENELFFDERFLSLSYEHMVTLIHKYVIQHSDYGYVNAQNAQYVFEVFDRLIDHILSLNQPNQQINLLVQLLSIGGNLNEIDHSYGYLQDVQMNILNNINLMIDQFSDNFNEKERLMILNNAFIYHSESNLLGIDDWRNQLFTDLVPLCNTPKLYDDFDDHLSTIESIISNEENSNDYYSNYREEAIKVVRYYLLESKDSNIALQYVMEHIHLSSFKEIYLEILARNNDYQALIDTTSQYCQNKTGNHSLYLKYQLLGAEKLGKKKLVRESAKSLMELREYEYYDIYKDTFDIEDKDEAIEVLMNKGDFYLRQYILIREDKQSIMVEDINNRPSLLHVYYKNLSPDSLKQVKEAYKKLIMQEAEQANKRSHYRKVCRSIKSYQKDYQTNANDIIYKLEYVYNRKTAFLDELSKIKK
jgi:hypothetical protein